MKKYSELVQYLLNNLKSCIVYVRDNNLTNAKVAVKEEEIDAYLDCLEGLIPENELLEFMNTI